MTCDLFAALHAIHAMSQLALGGTVIVAPRAREPVSKFGLHCKPCHFHRVTLALKVVGGTFVLFFISVPGTHSTGPLISSVSVRTYRQYAKNL